jgi:hypothetical protein
MVRKVAFCAFVLLLPLFGWSQSRIRISGTVEVAVRKHNSGFVDVNDTLRRYRARYLNDTVYRAERWEAYDRLADDSTLHCMAGADKSFTVYATRNDTLYFSSDTYHTQRYAVKDLLKRKRIRIVLEEIPCTPYIPCTDTTPKKFYALVGEKVSIKQAPEVRYCNTFSLDGPGMIATFKVMHQVYGHYTRDTITFQASTHRPIPEFTDSKHVLLFISEYCGKLYLEKYQFFDVYPTEDGRWASPGDPYRFDRNVAKTVQAQPIDFKDVTLSALRKDFLEYPDIKYEAPYFRIEGNKAYPLQGAYVEDLFKIKKDGILKTRKIFPRNDE